MLVESLAITLLFMAEAAPTKPIVRAELQPLEFLVGRCWTASFPDGKITDTHCFEIVYGGQFIRDRHVVKGAKAPYEGETLYAWDPHKKTITYTYWNSIGGVSTGVAEPTGESEISFREAHVAAAGDKELKTVWARRGETYESRTLQKNGSEWREMWTMRFQPDLAGMEGAKKAGEP